MAATIGRALRPEDLRRADEFLADQVRRIARLSASSGIARLDDPEWCEKAAEAAMKTFEAIAKSPMPAHIRTTCRSLYLDELETIRRRLDVTPVLALD